MAKITIADISAQFASTATINARLQQIEDWINADALSRDSTTEATASETNHMNRDLDMNSNDILNLSQATIDAITTTGGSFSLSTDNTWTGTNTFNGSLLPRGNLQASGGAGEVVQINGYDSFHVWNIPEIVIEADAGELLIQTVNIGVGADRLTPTTTNTLEVVKTAAANARLTVIGSAGEGIELVPKNDGRVEVTAGVFKLPTYTNVAAVTATPEAGDLAYNTTDNEPMYYNGSAWKQFDGGTPT